MSVRAITRQIHGGIIGREWLCCPGLAGTDDWRERTHVTPERFLIVPKDAAFNWCPGIAERLDGSPNGPSPEE